MTAHVIDETTGAGEAPAAEKIRAAVAHNQSSTR